MSKDKLLLTTPKVQPLLLPVLKALADGVEHPVEEIRQRVAENSQLSDEYVKPINPKTNRPFYVNHVAFALAHLQFGKAIIKTRVGAYQIDERGRTILAGGVSDLTIDELRTPEQ